MYNCQGIFCFIEELSTSNEYELYKLIHNNNEEYQSKISDIRIPEEFTDFKKYYYCGFLKEK